MRTQRISQRWLRRGVAAAAVTAGLSLALAANSTTAGKAAPRGTVSYVKGSAERTGAGPASWSTLATATAIFEGDRVRTNDDSRLEIRLQDGSMLRLGARSEVGLEQLKVGGKGGGTKKVRTRLLLGRVWAAVTKLVGQESHFEVTTANAVAGVRGTRFSAEHLATGATQVKVYSGKVLVSNKPVYAVEGHTKANRVQVAGPQEISKKQWEELVAEGMQAVSIAANGTMSPAEKFALADPGADDWEAWNAERDRLAGLGE